MNENEAQVINDIRATQEAIGSILIPSEGGGPSSPEELVPEDKPAEEPKAELPKAEPRPLLLNLKMLDRNIKKLDRKLAWMVSVELDGTLKYCVDPHMPCLSYEWRSTTDGCVRLSARDCRIYISSMKSSYDETKMKIARKLRCQLVDQELAAYLFELKCSIEDAIPASVLAIIKSAPMNPQARTIVHSIMGVPVPEDLDTYEKIQTWVEKTGRKQDLANPSGINLQKIGNLKVNFQAHSTVIGKARYSDQRTWYADAKVSPEEIQALIKAYPHADVDQLTGLIIDKIKADAMRRLTDTYQLNGVTTLLSEYSTEEVNYDHECEESATPIEVEIPGDITNMVEAALEGHRYY